MRVTNFVPNKEFCDERRPTRRNDGAKPDAETLALAERDRDAAQAEVQRLRRDLAGLDARATQVEGAATAWRNHALERGQRVTYLEAELAAAQAAASKASASESGKLLLASLASLGIGMVLSGDDAPKRPRRKLRE